jgi:hypothetical protein
MDSSYQDILELKRITVAKADIDGDGKFDLLTGCNSGGMRLYTQYTSAGISSADDGINFNFRLIPNPAKDFCLLNIQSESTDREFQVELVDLSGRILFAETTFHKQMQLNTTHLTSGIYIVQVKSDSYLTAKKLFIQR